MVGRFTVQPSAIQKIKIFLGESILNICFINLTKTDIFKGQNITNTTDDNVVHTNNIMRTLLA